MFIYILENLNPAFPTADVAHCEYDLRELQWALHTFGNAITNLHTFSNNLQFENNHVFLVFFCGFEMSI